MGRIGQNGQLTVGFQNGIADFRNTAVAADAQLLDEIAEAIIAAAQFVIEDLAVVNEDIGFAAEDQAEFSALQGEKG